MTGGRSGLFVTLEGGEGVGKSTQIGLLSDRLRAEGHDVLATREPGGSVKAETIRALLLSGAVAPFGTGAEAILFAAARLDHLQHTIRPALVNGTHVLCDRFADSTRAYQGALGAVPEAAIMALERIAVGPTKPDLTLILALPAPLGLARARARRHGTTGPDRFEREEQLFHRKLRQVFRDIAAGDPARCLVIDADRDIDAVAASIWTAVQACLEQPIRSGGR